MAANTVPVRPAVGLASIALAILFNVPFSILGATYDYPDILRRPGAEALDRFAAGGNGLILTWHAFALVALALVPMAIFLSLTPERVAGHFAHNAPSHVERFDLPGSNAINFVLHDVLGGGGMASLRTDNLAKCYAQVLLALEVPLPDGLVLYHVVAGAPSWRSMSTS